MIRTDQTASVDSHAPRFQWRHFFTNIVSPSIVTFALFLALIFLIVIPTMQRTILDRKKEMIRELTQAAWSELASLYEEEQQGGLDRAAAQQVARARIQRLRYGDDGKDYFWISDMRPVMVMHPYRPELNGQSLARYTDPAGKKLFVESVAVVHERGEGYVEYLWQWKDDEKRIVPKLSYVKGFTPWGWIIGTGIYLEDVRTEIGQITRRVLQVSLAISALMAALLLYIAKQGLDLERQRWKASLALSESEAKYRMVVEGVSEGILLVMEGHPVYANPTLLRLLGYTEAELQALHLDQILQPNAIATPERHAKLIKKNGEAVDVLLASAPVTIEERTGDILSLKDVSARRATEETLARLIAELQSMLPLATRPIKTSPPALLTCDLDTSIEKAAGSMARARSSAVLVQTSAGDPLGIVTDRDLRDRVLAVGVDPRRPVSSIMSAPLIRIADHALLFEAALVMQERDVQHLVVVDEQQRPVGILNGAEILHTQRHALALLLAEIRAAGSPEQLKDSQSRLLVFVRALLDGGARIENVTRIMATVSDAILIRLIALAEAELGIPPVPYSFLVMGSAARGEQTLATDQDNAIIYADVAPEQDVAVAGYFLRLGEKVCRWLDDSGYRRCKGNTMASNPKWCQPLSRWKDYLTSYVKDASPQDLLDVNIIFDFRCAWGEADYATQLRQHLRSLLGDGAPIFFFHLAQSTLQFKPPTGFFGNIQLEMSRGHASSFNIKSAMIPLVNFARMYALRGALVELNTLDRLDRLRDAGVLKPSSHDELAQAYVALMGMRLTHQAKQWSRGNEPDNNIDLGELTQIERSVLKRVFADIAVFQARLEHDFARTV